MHQDKSVAVGKGSWTQTKGAIKILKCIEIAQRADKSQLFKIDNLQGRHN